jgi:uncharacterized repeat protein (TIGR01451 family)
MYANSARQNSGASRARAALVLLAGSTMLWPISAAQAAGTRAGTNIDNTATATYDVGATTGTVNSNTHRILVDELINVTVDWTDPADVPTTPGSTNQVTAYQVTNIGNGIETYALSTVSTVPGDNYDPTVTSLVIDDGDGVYEPGIDVVYVPGANNPVLNPDQSVTIFVLVTTPGTVVDGNRGAVQLVATSTTGPGTAAPGTSVPGAGEGGGNAVFGTSGGDDFDTGFYRVSSAVVALVKSATVADPFGGTTSVPGSLVTYTIVANVTGTGSLANLRISDAIPTGTTYQPGTITLGGVGQTDATDADAGNFASNTVNVNLGTVAGGNSRTVTFQVRINN